ncbi:MAG: DUF5103 domain-containing protein [Prevotellaceae bacterium]|jgi:hypothetical protein|nr:DUF5103 domain-containing protein [Prevotellaceae bacterium]
MYRLFYFVALCCLPLVAGGQSAEAQANRQLRWKDACYDTHIRSIQLFKGDNELSWPALTLGLDEYLTLWFDDLSESRPSLRYTIVHCTADWEEDNLFLADYLDGYPENYLYDYAHSHITRTAYVHYTLQIPNRDVQLKASGNYLLKVYDESASQPLFVRGFSVLEPKSSATALRLRGPAVTGELCLQQLEIAVAHPQLDVRNAFRELKVRVEQNGYRTPGAEQPVPAFVDNGRTDFSQINRNWYAGGNEFRFFDTRNPDFSGQGVAQMHTDERGFSYALLQPDRPRNKYFYERDLNGRFRVDAARTLERHTEADYVTVIFTLPYDEPFDGEVYVFGALSNYTLHPAFRMEYNAQRRAYELNAPVKQGLYNYRYVVLRHDGTVDWEAVEGCFAETENTYYIYMYFRGVRDRYDRLVGLFTVNTER